MGKGEDRSWLRETRALLLVLLAAALMAVGGVGWMALSHGRSGTYQVQNILLSPDLLLDKVSLQDFDFPARLQRSWVFDRVEITGIDPQEGKWRRQEVSPQAYNHFYQVIAKQQSLRESPDQFALQFTGRQVVTLKLTLSPQGPYAAALSPEEFQEVQFAPGGIMRVQLHEQGNQWAYFRIPALDRKVKELFADGG